MRARVMVGWLVVAVGGQVAAAEFPRFERQEIDPHVGNVCYAITTADINGDGRLDVVAVSEDAVVWYANPTWDRREIVRGVTERDNVCIAPADIDGDGKIDLALGAGWRPPDTQKPSTLQWLGRDEQGAWQVNPIHFDEPSMHRIRWGDVLGTGKPQLVVAPLQGKGTRGPNWGEGAGVRVLAFEVPDPPTSPDWPATVLSDSLHTVHNVWLANLDETPGLEVLLAAWEGVFAVERRGEGWHTRKLGTGNQTATPFKGASEIKLGLRADGSRYLATIEPWHGTQVVVYTPTAEDERAWIRQVIAEPVQWGHAVWTANLDGDGHDELVIGQRDPNPEGATPRGPGVYVFDPVPGSNPMRFQRHALDEGGMACEDAMAADLDGDGRLDVIAGGRATHNVVIYWNRGTAR